MTEGGGPEVLFHGLKVPLRDISIAGESGWRSSQKAVVSSFVTRFPAEYGAGLFRPIRLLAVGNAAVKDGEPFPMTCLATISETDADGKTKPKLLLDDGKSSIDALIQISDAGAGVDITSNLLKAVISSGQVVADVVKYNGPNTRLERQSKLLTFQISSLSEKRIY